MVFPNDFSIQEYLEEFTFKEDINLFSFTSPECAVGKKTMLDEIEIGDNRIKKYINEYWTAKQRKSSSIHEISYRACFKGQLPKFFIKLLTKEKDVVYDPFSGRGTTGIEAALNDRNIILNDINPLSERLSRPRLSIPTLDEIQERFQEIPFKDGLKADIDLSMFYHTDTESEIVSLRNYFQERMKKNEEDHIDRWIRMIATNRLTGHSPGFFSVYSLPPNQAVSQESQVKINIKRNQVPDYRNTKELILKKSRRTLKDITPEIRKNMFQIGKDALFLNKDARETTEIKDETVQLTVTSPPFLNIVQYSKDNWLRCWFNTLDAEEIDKRITMSRKVEDWSDVMGDVFKELYRITRPGGWVAFEVGEVNKGKIRLEEYVLPLGIKAGFKCEGVLINLQEFTKTSNIWGVKNMDLGTNSNRISIFHKK